MYLSQDHSGLLGWSGGAALGARLTHPDHIVVCAVGDGRHTASGSTTLRGCRTRWLDVVRRERRQVLLYVIAR